MRLLAGSFFFYSAARHRDSGGSTPPICPFTHSHYGPVFRGLQHIALLLTSSLPGLWSSISSTLLTQVVRWEAEVERSISKKVLLFFLAPSSRKASQLDWVQIVDLVTTMRRVFFTQKGLFFLKSLWANWTSAFPLKLRQLVPHPSRLRGFCTNAFTCAGRGLIGSAPARQSSCTAEIVNDNIQTNRGPRLQRCACSWKVCNEKFRQTNIVLIKEPLAPDAAAPLVLCDKPKRVR